MTVRNDSDSVKCDVYGNEVEPATKRPMDKEAVLKQLSKLGNTPFEAENIDITIDDYDSGCGIFMAVSELNDLRRKLCDEMLGRLLPKTDVSKLNKKSDEAFTNGRSGKVVQSKVHVLVNTKDQLNAALEFISSGYEIDRLYIDLYLLLGRDISFIPSDYKEKVVIALPYMTRTESFDGTMDIVSALEIAETNGFYGVLVRNLEQLGVIKEKGFSRNIVPDYGIYIWNSQAMKLISELKDFGLKIEDMSVPYELTFHEAKELVNNIDVETTLNVYGKTPMMITANCVKKTMDKCSGKMNTIHSESITMFDRMNNKLHVTTNCRNCYNVIWNAYPTSLYKKLTDIENASLFDYLRVDFSDENFEETKKILRAFICRDDEADRYFDSHESQYTTGHFKRGVE